MNYLDKIRYLYPCIQRVMFWHTQQDGTPWKNLYDGIVWENTEIEKPSQATLDALDNEIVEAELNRRAEVTRKEVRNAKAKKDMSILSGFGVWSHNHAGTLSDYLDYLEAKLT